MTTCPRIFARRPGGFTLTEIMVAMTICSLVVAGSLTTFTIGLRTMYKDTQRLATNAALRSFTTQVAKETLDSTEFYVFPNYEKLDGNINLTTDYSEEEGEVGQYMFHGDCLLLVTRTSNAVDAKVRMFRIYYRTTTTPNTIAPIRYYESQDYGASGSNSSLTALLNAINLKTTPAFSGSREVVKSARGRLKSGSTTECHPIFSTESETVTPVNISVSINVEIITGTTNNNMLSSSSFNYTISPRR